MQQDIFASGLAREAPDSEDAQAARATPGQVVERGLAVDAGQVGVRREKKKVRAGPTAAQRRRVETIAVKLQDLERSHAEAQAVLEQAIQALERRRDEERRRFSDARTRLAGDLEAARAKV